MLNSTSITNGPSSECPDISHFPGSSPGRSIMPLAFILTLAPKVGEGSHPSPDWCYSTFAKPVSLAKTDCPSLLGS